VSELYRYGEGATRAWCGSPNTLRGAVYAGVE